MVPDCCADSTDDPFADAEQILLDPDFLGAALFL